MSAPAADRLVPARGGTRGLTVAAAAALAFLATLLAAGALAALGLAHRWDRALEGVGTVEIASGDSATLARALALLRETPGVTSAEEVDAARARAALAPWLGADFPLETLALPRLIEIREAPGLDRAALRDRLAEAAPGARYLAPEPWQGEVAARAARLGWLAAGLAALAIAVTAALVALAVSAALAAEAGTVETLRLIGAEDGFIRAAFVRRFTRRALAGATAGTLAALALLLAAGLPGAAGIGPAALLPLLALPLLAAAVAAAATRVAADRILARTP